jgi:hypothetical protein
MFVLVNTDSTHATLIVKSSSSVAVVCGRRLGALPGQARSAASTYVAQRAWNRKGYES